MKRVSVGRMGGNCGFGFVLGYGICFVHGGRGDLSLSDSILRKLKMANKVKRREMRCFYRNIRQL